MGLGFKARRLQLDKPHGGFRKHGVPVLRVSFAKDYSIWGYVRGTPILGNAHMTRICLGHTKEEQLIIRRSRSRCRSPTCAYSAVRQLLIATVVLTWGLFLHLLGSHFRCRDGEVLVAPIFDWSEEACGELEPCFRLQHPSPATGEPQASEEGKL